VAPEHIRKNRFRRFGEEKAPCRGGDDGRGVRSEATLLVMGCLALYQIFQRDALYYRYIYIIVKYSITVSSGAGLQARKRGQTVLCVSQTTPETPMS